MQNGVGVKGIPIPEAFHCWIGLDCSPFTEHRTAWHAWGEFEMWKEDSDLLLGLHFGHFKEQLAEDKEANNRGLDSSGFPHIWLDVTFHILRLNPHR